MKKGDIFSILLGCLGLWLWPNRWEAVPWQATLHRQHLRSPLCLGSQCKEDQPARWCWVPSGGQHGKEVPGCSDSLHEHGCGVWCQWGPGNVDLFTLSFFLFLRFWWNVDFIEANILFEGPDDQTRTNSSGWSTHTGTLGTNSSAQHK